ncbi:hypothetical protein ABGB18_46195 [Nonomuraea sp. B12E4]|uniref:hypothetical protein n=1 Tax=Nonomuraea sp. B12E4 TaxID=3153564 RepID=UPI00325F82AB
MKVNKRTFLMAGVAGAMAVLVSATPAFAGTDIGWTYNGDKKASARFVQNGDKI